MCRRSSGKRCRPAGPRWQISTGGGQKPLWPPDGREVFYLAPSGDVMAVPVQTEPTLTSGQRCGPGRGPHTCEPVRCRAYDMTPDGQRFLMMKESTAAGAPEAGQIILVQNWSEELKARVPVN